MITIEQKRISFVKTNAFTLTTNAISTLHASKVEVPSCLAYRYAAAVHSLH